MMNGWNVGHGYYRLCWTGPSAFRKRIAPDYKANRAAVLKPIGYKAMKRELLDEPTSFLHDEIEADDWLGCWPVRYVRQRSRSSSAVTRI